MQLDFISSPVLSWISRTASGLVRVMKNPSISTCSTVCNVIHYAKMPSHQSPRRSKASMLKADFKEPTRTCVMLPTPCCLMFTCLFYVSVVVFFRNSMLVCGMSLVVTLLVRWMGWTSAVPPSWMSAIAVKLQGSVVGRLLLFWQVRKLV
jgi:hypothetical protein